MSAPSLRETKPAGSNSLRSWLEALDAAGLLYRVNAEVDPVHEIGAICARSIDRGGPAILFENVTGYPGLALAANLLSSDRHLALAFGTEEDEHEIYQALVRGMQHRLPSVIVETGPCKEEIFSGDDVDLYKFPTPTWHELDGGQYPVTTGGVITRDPNTGNLNMGSYRCMIKDRNTLSMSGGIRTFKDPGGGNHVLANEAQGDPTPVAIALGMDPYLSLATGTGVPVDEEGLGEFDAAGAWRGSPTELVRAELSDLLVPAQAEVVLEGEFVPNSRVEEGPHGEATGFYGRTTRAFEIKVHSITHRKNPVSYGLICRLLEDYPRALLRSGSFQTLLMRDAGLTNIREAYFPEVGQLGLIIISASIQDPDEPRRIMDAVWENGHWRWVVVVDEDCDVRNWWDVMWRVTSLADPDKHIVPGKEHPADAGHQAGDKDFNPPRRGLGIDATLRFKDGTFPPVNTISRELMSRVAGRWRELGLP